MNSMNFMNSKLLNHDSAKLKLNYIMESHRYVTQISRMIYHYTDRSICPLINYVHVHHIEYNSQILGTSVLDVKSLAQKDS